MTPSSSDDTALSTDELKMEDVKGTGLFRKFLGIKKLLSISGQNLRNNTTIKPYYSKDFEAKPMRLA